MKSDIIFAFWTKTHLIFINDIPYASDLGTWLFADDTALVASACNISLLQHKMNIEVDKIQTWLLHSNKLSVHYVDKSQYMLINSNITKSIESNFELKMGGHVIDRAKSYQVTSYKFYWELREQLPSLPRK